MILAVDQGTTGTTCLALDDDLRVTGRGYRELPQHFPRPGWVEHDPFEIWDSVVAAAEVDWSAWPRPQVFHWLARHVEEDELRRVFNLGIGWCAVVAEPDPGDLVLGRIA